MSGTDLASRLAARGVSQGGPDVFSLLDRQRPQIELALPRASGLTAERFARIVATEIRRTPALLECEPVTVVAGVMLGAQLGLEPGVLGQFYLVPFGDSRTGTKVATFILGYKGMISLAYRSRGLLSLTAREVCEVDQFEYSFGLEDHLRHRPAASDRGPLTHVYAVAQLRGGGRSLVVLSREEVDRSRARSRGAKAASSPWQTDEAAMWRKTAVRRLFPYLPLATDAARGAAADDSVAREIVPDVASTVDVSAVEVGSGGGQEQG